MADKDAESRQDYQIADPGEFVRNMARVMDRTAEIAADFASRIDSDDARARHDDQSEQFAHIARTFFDIAQGYAAAPNKLMDAQLRLWQQYGELWQTSWKRLLGEETGPVVQPARGDRRFKDPEWEENQVFDFLKQAYLIAAQWAQDIVEETETVDERTRQRARFYVDQLTNALSPSNFAFTNPEVLRTTLASNAQNLVEGMEHLKEDLKAGRGSLRIKQTDFDAFEVGRNIAVTPGKVIYQNELMQLIQYAPTTEKVFKRPLLIVPPWINKYYILDLNPKKSLVSWLVDQGFTVFVISWVNPDERLAMKGFSDYMREGVLEAVSAVGKATGEDDLNIVGYCIGGTLTAATLAYMAEKGDDRVKSATFLTTQVDFEKAGDLMNFVDEDQLKTLERSMARKGYLEGGRMATAFNLLRSNDLIWSYVVNNYLLGREPMAFDLLYWNADPTRMPAATHSFYLRECYLNNRMSKGEMVLDGVRIDLKQVKVPAYNLATREDHIAPLASAFRVGKCLGGKTRLVVAASGHIAGVVNPPDAKKYMHWTNDKDADTLEDWLAGATEHPGSWWPDWKRWITPRAGRKVPARHPGDGGLKPVEDAPGSYVKVRAD